MKLGFLSVLLAAAAIVAAAVPSAAQTTAPNFHLLDVPYVPQSEELCGGAAAAMVMRFWGATGVYAESFSDLVDRAAGGIRGGDLVHALEQRGWQASSISGGPETIRTSLEQRRPPVVLIEDRPGRFHYVVVVGWSGGRVVVHDPARAPFRILDEAAFARAWSRSDNWMLQLLPGRETGVAATNRTTDDATPATAAAVGRGACGPMVDEAVRLADAGSLDEARELLEMATSRCASEAAPWRELAGIHALRKDWRRAASDARQALTRDARDEHAARILATSLFLEGDAAGALEAWNRVNEPTIDLIDVRGLERTRYAVVARALGLEPRATLTPDGLRRASRRLDALPVAQGSRVSYTPRDGGLATVTAAVIERPLLPSSAILLTATAAGALVDRELRVGIAGATGGGELLTAGWRWWERRPRVSLGFAAPAPFGGTWGISAFDERQSYADPGAPLEERRRRAAFDVADWATGTLGWRASVGVERWPGATAASVGAGLDYHLIPELIVLSGNAGVWSAPGRTWTADLAIDARSQARNEGTVWIGRAGVAAAGEASPLALWPGAGTGQGRTEFLRAHPLLDDGVIRDGAFGPRLAHASVEWRRWRGPIFKVLRLAPAAFVDVARAFDAPPYADGRGQIDVGAGLRIALPGAGMLRADVATGLRDGRTALSFGWTR